MKVYICGKITNLPGYMARYYFSNVEKMLKDQGHEPLNPMNLPHNHSKSWEDYMKECIAALVQCDGIYLMGNWHDSRGARLEFNIAKQLGLEVLSSENIERETYHADQWSHHICPEAFKRIVGKYPPDGSLPKIIKWNYKGILYKARIAPVFPASKGDTYILSPDITGSSDIINGLSWEGIVGANKEPNFIPPVDTLVLNCIEDDNIGDPLKWRLIIRQGSIGEEGNPNKQAIRELTS